MTKLSLSPFLGLDEYTFPGFLREGYSPYARNVEVDGGILKSCDGFTVQSGEGFACTQAMWHYGAGGEKTLLVLSGGNLCREDGTVVRAGFGGEAVSVVNYQLNDQTITILCNGKQPPVKFDGVTASPLGGNPPVCGQAVLHSERVFLAGEAAHPDRVYYSASFAPEDWSTPEKTGFIDIPTWNGGRIQALRSLFGDLVVFKDADIFRIYGTYPGEFGVEKIHSAVGCVSAGSIAMTGEACYFVSQRGLCVYNGLMAKPVSDKRLTALFARVAPEKTREIQSVWLDGRLYLTLPLKDEPEAVLEYQPETGVMGLKTGIPVRQFFLRDGRLWFVHTDGRLCRYDDGTDFGGQPIQSVWRSKTYDLGAKHAVKHLEAVYCGLKGSGELTIKVVAGGKTREKRVTLPPAWKQVRLPLHGRGRQFYLELCNVSGSRFTVDTPTLMVDMEED